MTIHTLAFMLFAFMSSAHASKPSLDLLKKNLSPEADIQAITPSVVPGLYQLQISDQIVYLSADGKTLFSGDLFNLEKKISHTDMARNAIRKEKLARVKDIDQIVYKAKDEKYRVTVFTDISCTYCRKLHEHIDEFNDLGITVAYMAFPRAGAGSKTQKEMQKIWCAEDKQKSLTVAKLKGKLPKQTCRKKQTINQFILGQSISVAATPTFVFANGRLEAGYIQPETLLKLLQNER